MQDTERTATFGLVMDSESFLFECVKVSTIAASAMIVVLSV